MIKAISLLITSESKAAAEGCTRSVLLSDFSAGCTWSPRTNLCRPWTGRDFLWLGDDPLGKLREKLDSAKDAVATLRRESGTLLLRRANSPA
jgi:hypothetical protein